MDQMPQRPHHHCGSGDLALFLDDDGDGVGDLDEEEEELSCSFLW